MTTEMAKKIANPFRSDDCCRPQIKEVCVAGRYVYATDGRTAIRIRRDDDSPDEIPEHGGKKFPFADIDRMCDRSVARTETLPFVVPDSYDREYLARRNKFYSKRLEDKWREIADARSTWMNCPCCGEKIYIFNGEARTEEYVNSMEKEPVSMYGFDHIVRIVMRECTKLMQYEFIHRAVNALGDRKAAVCVAQDVDTDSSRYDMVRVDANDITILMMPMFDEPRDDIRDVLDFNVKED